MPIPEDSYAAHEHARATGEVISVLAGAQMEQSIHSEMAKHGAVMCSVFHVL